MITLASNDTKCATIKSLCDTCGKAFPQLCVYMDANSEGIEAALTVLQAKAVKFVSNRQNSAVYKVTRCPKHVPANLPELPKNKRESVEALNAKMAGYDIGCPHCGNVYGNGVARAGILKPEEWYCRCGQCKKSYRPRRLTNEDMTLKEDFYRIMTKEKYLELRAQGITSDAKILSAVGLPYNSYIKFLTEAKKEWGIPGKRIGQENDNAQNLNDNPDPCNENGIPVNDNPDPVNEPQDGAIQAEPTGEGEIPDDTFPPLQPADDTEKTCEPVQPEAEEQAPDYVPMYPEPNPVISKLTINQAIELRIKLTEEVDCVNYIYSEATTDGVRTILDCHRKLCTKQLEAINNIFERIVITI